MVMWTGMSMPGLAGQQTGGPHGQVGVVGRDQIGVGAVDRDAPVVSRLDADVVMETNCLEHRCQVVEPIRAPRTDHELEVDLGRNPGRDAVP